MDIPQLTTASAYVNNLLLARGLLRNGKPVDFASLAGSAKRGHETGSSPLTGHAVVAAETINLVHDLVLRRDRDSDQLASLAESLSELRSASQSHTSQLERSKTLTKDLRRELDISHSSLRSANTTLRSSEASVRAMKEELLKTKTTLSQVKTQCANDIRKRDVQIQKLKTHLSASQRGSAGRTAPTCTISLSQSQNSWPVGKSSGNGSAVTARQGMQEEIPSLEDAQYSLKQETTDFLTRLSQNLSDENDSLIALMRNSLETLRQLQNLPPSSLPKLSSRDGTLREGVDDEMLQVVPTSYNAISTEVEYVLANLKAILTDASFVSIDEVINRDEEIHRLREGWEKMERRWREVVEMMKSWQDRLLQGGAMVNLEELRCGLGLGEEVQGMRLLDAGSLFQSGSEAEVVMPELPEDESSFEVEDYQPWQSSNCPNDRQLFDKFDHQSSVFGSGSSASPLQERPSNVNMPPPETFAAKNKPKNTSLDDPLSQARSDHDLKENTENIEVAQSPLRKPELNTIQARKAAAKDNTKNPKYTSTPMRNRNSTSKPLHTQGSSRTTSRSLRYSSEKTAATDSQPTCMNAEERSILPTSLDNDDREVPMTIEEKLLFAESEARRVSGTSASSISPPQVDHPVQLRFGEATSAMPEEATNDASETAEPIQVAANGTTECSPSAHIETQDVQKNVKAPSSSRPKTAASTQKIKVGGSIKGTKTAQKPGPPTQPGRTATTRVPTKPPAPSGTSSRNPKSKPNIQASNTEARAQKRKGQDIDASLRRSRRKRKSTLSPEELEELMGMSHKDDQLAA